MSEQEVRSLGDSGQLQIFFDRTTVLYKKEQVDLYQSSITPESIPEHTPKEISSKSDIYQTTSLVLMGICFLTFIVSVFAKRMYLLEFFIPIVALAGLAFFGLGLMQHMKQKKQEEQNAKAEEETDKLITQIERLRNVSENPSKK
jgi:hypothetical protein